MDELPRWDMTPVFPGLASPEYEQAFTAWLTEIEALEALFNQHNVRKQASAALTPAHLASFEAVVASFSQALEHGATLRAYIFAFVATDSRDNLAQARLSEFQGKGVRLTKLQARFNAWIGGLDVDALLQQSETARQYTHLLHRAQVYAAHQMEPPEEALAADLGLTGGSAWMRLHGNVSSQIMVPVPGPDGQTTILPMPAARNLGSDPDRRVRQAAYTAELQAWRQAAVPLAAALNSIKGEVNTLARRRGWDSPLEAALFENAIDRPTLEALLEAMRSSFPDFRRYLHAKAKMLGLERLAWYDLSAPVAGKPGDSQVAEWSYPGAAEFIVARFSEYSARMGGLAQRAFSENWIDAGPRPGKRDGAFCMRLRNEESRILANFKPTIRSMSTLAHELGHAYHNLNLAQRPFLCRETPSTLAETASIFCETIVRQSAMRTASPAAQLEILESALHGACQVVVDISCRFQFESQVFARRVQRELSVDELCELMTANQLDTYGDGLDPTRLHPTMWAVKQHYYSTTNSFYNFPYAFGLLFGLGLYARYVQDPNGFRSGYDELLASTGQADAATLAARMGIDLRSLDFWNGSLDTIRADIVRFEALAQG